MTITATKPTAETPLDATVLGSVFQTLKAYYTGNLSDTFDSGATQADKDRLRLRLREYDAHSEMKPVVLLVRRYFNTYRAKGWKIAGWQVASALRLLSTVAESVAATSDVWELESERVAALGLDGTDAH